MFFPVFLFAEFALYSSTDVRFNAYVHLKFFHPWPIELPIQCYYKYYRHLYYYNHYHFYMWS